MNWNNEIKSWDLFLDNQSNICVLCCQKVLLATTIHTQFKLFLFNLQTMSDYKWYAKKTDTKKKKKQTKKNYVVFEGGF